MECTCLDTPAAASAVYIRTPFFRSRVPDPCTWTIRFAPVSPFTPHLTNTTLIALGHSCYHSGFKKRAPRAIAAIRKFALDVSLCLWQLWRWWRHAIPRTPVSCGAPTLSGQVANMHTRSAVDRVFFCRCSLSSTFGRIDCQNVCAVGPVTSPLLVCPTRSHASTGTRQTMKTKDVRVDTELNKFLWSKGIR